MNKHLFIEEPEGEFCELKITYKELIKMSYKIDKLQQENERLNENNMSYQEEMARTWKITDDYKSRIEKAVEELELWQPKIETIKLEKEYLLDILNGRSDE